MRRNENRHYYDQGYSDGVQERRKENTIPKLLGMSLLSVLLIIDQYWIIAVFIIYAAFELLEYRDVKKYHESNPPEMWEQ